MSRGRVEGFMNPDVRGEVKHEQSELGMYSVVNQSITREKNPTKGS